MIQLKDLIQRLEQWAPPAWQESYDNAGLIYGNPHAIINKALITLDITEAVVEEAVKNGANLIIAHHPVVFKAISKLNTQLETHRVLIQCIKHEIAIYAIHTNLDNVHNGVNYKIAQKLCLNNLRVLDPKKGLLSKLLVYVPNTHLEQVRSAIFEAGAGKIGNYDECSFSVEGMGTFKAGDATQPFVGEKGKRHTEAESKLEVVLPSYLVSKVVSAMQKSHPYEEIAYDIVALQNTHPQAGSGLIGTLEHELTAEAFLAHLKQKMNVHYIRYTHTSKMIKTVAVCGGAGSFLIKNAVQAGADAYVTADVKYHEFFDALPSMLLADIGHYESEIFTKELIHEHILKIFPTFAVLLSQINTNPIKYI
jgi:dinuclear metal center YbgI/SA1388 family protein